MELTVQNVYGLLLRSKLLSLDQAKAMLARWQGEAKEASNNLARFAGWMVANRYLTAYQASLLARGFAEGFFLNDYKILDRLGKGRMAGVYKAQHRLGQIVAIKVLPPTRAKDPTVLARFQREAKLATRLKHPNIVRTFQTGTANTLHYLVMEHLDGETLEEILTRRKQFPPTEAVRLIYQALQGLQHIHSHSLVHRDLKPANLMLVPPPGPGDTLRCTVKILDIGLGRVFSEEQPGTEGEPALTSEGVLLGTPDYMAPEQARDPRTTDIRADVYSLGCVLYHLLTGQTPFPDTNIISQMIRHATEMARPAKEFNPAVPDGLQQILNWMMAKEPAKRYPTPERAAQALEVFLAAGSSPPLSSPVLDPTMQPYLKWLESAEPDAKTPAGKATPKQAAGAANVATLPVVPPPLPGAAKPPTATMPAAGAVPPGTPNSGNRPDKGKKAERVRAATARRRGKKGRNPPPAPPLPVEVQPAEPINVELVPLSQFERPGKKLLGLSRRDFIMFSAGVVSVLTAILGGWLLAQLFRK
jgi:serine/threonine protein kinase